MSSFPATGSAKKFLEEALKEAVDIARAVFHSHRSVILEPSIPSLSNYTR